MPELARVSGDLGRSQGGRRRHRADGERPGLSAASCIHSPWNPLFFVNHPASGSGLRRTENPPPFGGIQALSRSAPGSHKPVSPQARVKGSSSFLTSICLAQRSSCELSHRPSSRLLTFCPREPATSTQGISDAHSLR